MAYTLVDFLPGMSKRRGTTGASIADYGYMSFAGTDQLRVSITRTARALIELHGSGARRKVYIEIAHAIEQRDFSIATLWGQIAQAVDDLLDR